MYPQESTREEAERRRAWESNAGFSMEHFRKIQMWFLTMKSFTLAFLFFLLIFSASALQCRPGITWVQHCVPMRPACPCAKRYRAAAVFDVSRQRAEVMNAIDLRAAVALCPSRCVSPGPRDVPYSQQPRR